MLFGQGRSGSAHHTIGPRIQVATLLSDERQRPLSQQGTETAQCAVLLRKLGPTFRCHRAPFSPHFPFELGHPFHQEIRHRCRGLLGRVGHRIGQGLIRLMPDARDHRDLHGSNGSAQRQVIEDIQIQLGASTAQQDHRIQWGPHGHPPCQVQGRHEALHRQCALNGCVDAGDVQNIPPSVVLHVGEEVRVTCGSRRPDQHHPLWHLRKGQPAIAADRPFLLQSQQGLLSPPLHFTEQGVQVNPLNVEGKAVDRVKSHVRAEDDFPAGLEHLLELLSEVLSDLGQGASPDGAANLGFSLPPLFLDQVDVGMLA